jgi:hypothetical protein
MRFTKTLSITVIALATIVSTVVATLPLPIGSTAISTYVPLSQRTFTAEDVANFEKLVSLTFDGFNDWSCKPKAGQRPVILVHGLVRKMSFPSYIIMVARQAKKSHQRTSSFFLVFMKTYSSSNISLPPFAILPTMSSLPQTSLVMGGITGLICHQGTLDVFIFNAAYIHSTFLTSGQVE